MTSLYKRILGEKYAILPKAVQQLHDFDSEAVYEGKCYVRRGTGLLSNIFADLLSLPKTGENSSVSVHFRSEGAKECWNRSFNGRPFRSVQWQAGDLLYEKLNFTTLVFKVVATGQMLDLDLQQVYVLGLPLIRFLSPKVIARETEEDGRFHFFIRTSLPLLGVLVEYEGNLERVK